LPEFKRTVVSFCVSCRQPIALPSKAAQREADFRKREQESNEDPIVPMFTLRCHACERETLYTCNNKLRAYNRSSELSNST
jgi:hypothetical protein